MEQYELKDEDGTAYVITEKRGRGVLCDPMLNKGSAFSPPEREALGLVGMLPPTESTDEVQLQRAYANIVRKAEPLEQYIGLAAMQDRNEILFYRLVLEHLTEFAPIVYTPTVGRACQTFSHIFRRGRGLWITPAHRGHIADVLRQAPYGNVRLICATDNERILGLGDQGAGGMGIPIGKLALYTVGAGIHPTQVLPISLDVGTDNEALIEDPLYLGYRHPRLRGDAYYELVDEFVEAVKEVFPDALLQWEDFKKGTAFELLSRYQSELLSFNDDIQGTAAVALAGVMASTRITGVAQKDLRVTILGAGAAGIGIGHQLRDALQRQGVEGDELSARIAVLDSRGLIVEGREFRDDYKREFAWPAVVAEAHGLASGAGLLEVVNAQKPHVLIGTSGQSGAFSQEIVEAVAKHVEQPLIFPFSNPTSKAEAFPEDIIAWTGGKALVASGSPFDPVVHEGKTHRIGQGNNVFIFPGVGLGALVAKSKRVTDRMFTVAAETLAQAIDEEDLKLRSLYPSLKELRGISRTIAVEVALTAAEQGMAPELSREEAEERVAATMWDPRYPEVRPG